MSESPQAELLAMAVHEQARGKGIGRDLVDALERDFVEWGLEGEYCVVTFTGDPGSNAFYRRIGFEPTRAFRHHENLMQEYRKCARGGNAPV